MPDSLEHRLGRAVAALPAAYPGPGGAVAVLHRGQVVARHAWGWANAERRIPFTPATLFRMCSITKQFTCAAMLDAFPDPSILDPDVRERLPLLQGPAPGALHLAHNQSGLRDYWAVAMLHGSPAEASFGDQEAGEVIGGTRSLQFAPGTRYSYVNQNFRLLSDILEQRAGRSFAELLRTRVFTPAGMATAILAADTRAMPDGTEGYEGTEATGFRPAVNRILWTGDAGLGASLDDMIAWERFIDDRRDEPGSLYGRLSIPVTFADGAPASYGFGLNRRTEFGRAVSGHGGALRGWRSHRLHAAAERLSVVVLFNHMADAAAAATDLLAAALDEDHPRADPALTTPDWLGAYIEPETGLSARIEAAAPGRLRLRFAHVAELLDLQPDGTARNAGGTLLRPGAQGLHMERPAENLRTILHPVAAAPAPTVPPPAVAGHYRNAELDAGLTLVDAGGTLYGAFSGFLGSGRMERLQPVGTDLWVLPCPRALDHAPPGDWTLAVGRQDGAPQGTPVGITVGCWLARGLRYNRVGHGGT